MSHIDPGPIPNRWLNCPKRATRLIANFLPFKTPLGSQFDEKVSPEYRFTPSNLFSSVKELKVKLGLWIDLTNTSRFYDKSEVERHGCKYVKMSCRGHGETPTPEQTRHFIETVRNFTNQNPNDVVGVHCTHGFNRTGFLIISYMVEEMDCSLDGALYEFSKVRTPGIYKQDYLDELFKRYEDATDDDVPDAPPRPQWCDEEEEFQDEEYPQDDYQQPDASHSSQDFGNSSTANEDAKDNHHKGRKDRKIKRKEFVPVLPGVNFYEDEEDVKAIQKKVRDYCKFSKRDFPGSQPVSMTKENIVLLHTKPYMVSWKADGVRYMMLIDGDDRVFMVDRDNCIFKVDGLIFPHNKTMKHLKNTLLDGEMVEDREGDVVIPRYLCYDIIRFEGMNVGKESFSPVRLNCIYNEIIKPRRRALESGSIGRGPFSVRLKYFWDINMTHCLLEEKFAKTLTHEPDGLIFQPAKEGYVAGACEEVLKWKPSHMNSVDFRLKIVVESGQGIVRRKVGHLYMGGSNYVADTINVTKEIKNLDNKIIECKYDREKRQWVFMRERTDKSYPNGKNTVKAVFKSIMDPVTKEYLLDYIRKYGFKDTDGDAEGPPMKRHRL